MDFIMTCIRWGVGLAIGSLSFCLAWLLIFLVLYWLGKMNAAIKKKN